MRRTFIIIGIVFAALMAGCSGSPQAGGTTDTGNARVAALIRTTSGLPAAGAMVTACPAAHYAHVDSNENGKDSTTLHTVTDDTGYFSFEKIDNGTWVIEVNDHSTGAVALDVVLTDGDKRSYFDTTLAPFAEIEGNAGAVADTTIERFCVIRGLDRKIPVKSDGSFRATDLPSGTFDCRIVAVSNRLETREFNAVYLQAGASVFIGDTIPNTVDDTSRITINTSPGGGGVQDGDIVNFPLLLRLDSASLDFSHVAANAGNVHIYRKNVTLDFTVEKWDSAAQQAIIWVMVDTIRGNDSTQQLLLVVRQRDNTPSEVVDANPFESSVGILAWYHFDGNLFDASMPRFDGKDSGSADTAGIVGNARAFNGKTSFVTIGDLPDRPAGTVSFWFRPNVSVNTSTESTQGFWGKKSTDSIDYTISLQGKDFWAGDGSPGMLISKLEDADTGFYLASTRKTFDKGGWYHVVWTWGNGGDSLYLNGALEDVTSGNVTMSGDGIEEIGRSFYDASNISGGGPRYFNGTIDEFRIENVSRSPEWIKLCYMNQHYDKPMITITK